MIFVVGDTPSSVEINAWGVALETRPADSQLQQAASVYEASTYIMSMVSTTSCTVNWAN